jgi:hypothetical protein
MARVLGPVHRRPNPAGRPWSPAGRSRRVTALALTSVLLLALLAGTAQGADTTGGHGDADAPAVTSVDTPVVAAATVEPLTRRGAIELADGDAYARSSLMAPAGDLLHLTTDWGRVVTVDLDSLTQVASHELPQGDPFNETALHSAVITPDGATALVGTAARLRESSVVRIDLAGPPTRAGAVQLPFDDRYLTSAVITPDGARALFGTELGRVVTIEVANLAHVRTTVVTEERAKLSAAAIDPTGTTAYFVTDRSDVVRVDVATGEATGTLRLGPNEAVLTSALMVPDGSALLVGTMTSGQVFRIDLDRFEIDRIGSVSPESHLYAAAISPDGRSAYFGTLYLGYPGRVIEVDVATMEPVSVLELHATERMLRTAAIAPDGRTLYLATDTDPAYVVAVDLPERPEPVDPVDPVEPITFPDVPATSVHAENIGRLVAADINQGFSDGTFRPALSVNRQQMASFVTRALDLPVPTRPVAFADVSPSNVHYDNIQALAAAEITLGCGGGRFCPNDPVTREQMASFLTRGLDLPAPTTPINFSDVSRTNVHRSNIQALAGAEITLGCGGDRFCPADPVRRDQMASFLIRGLDR